MALQAGFLMGGNTNETPQTLARKRALIAQIMANGKAPTNIGEGLNALGDGIVANVMGRRADKAEAAGQASANEAFSPIAAMFTGGGFGGMGGSSAPASSAPLSSPSPGQPPVPGLAQSGGSLYGDKGIDVSATEAYIRQSAQARGIDPDVAVRVARSEGLAPNTWQSNYVKNGKRETSYGPFQLLVGGGLGDKFQKIYGKSPEDPSTVQQQIDFALDEAAQGGWSPWYGAAKVGVGARTGLDQARALGYQAPAPAPTSAVEAVTAMGQGGQMPSQASAYVDPMVSAPNSQPQPALAPQQGPARNGLPFDLVSNSPQLARADTRQGILRALTGQTGPAPGVTGAFPSAPGSSPMSAPQATPAPSMAAPAPTQAAPAPAAPQGMGQVSTQQLIAAINNPWLNDSQRAIAQSMLDQQMQANDPMRQLQIQKLRQEVEGTGRGEIKIAGDRALLLKPDGTVEDVTPSLGGNQSNGFRYSGNSVEAQALNGLIDSGQISPEQAQQLGAGKTITGPNGEIIFMTPQGVFGQPAGGGAPQPMGGEPSLFPGDPSQSGPAAPAPSRTNIPITEPKVTLDEKKAMTFADRMVTSGELIDQFGSAGTDKMQVTMSQLPLGVGNMLVGEEFQKFDQARRDFINAQLRRESGAVISDEEFDNANKQYFPQPGDGPELMKQKAANRRVAIEGMVRDGGPTYKRPQSQKPAVDLSKPISEMTDEELEALANGD